MDHLADAPIANILILAGVIFLAVGLFGRIGGFCRELFAALGCSDYQRPQRCLTDRGDGAGKVLHLWRTAGWNAFGLQM